MECKPFFSWLSLSGISVPPRTLKHQDHTPPHFIEPLCLYYNMNRHNSVNLPFVLNVTLRSCLRKDFITKVSSSFSEDLLSRDETKMRHIKNEMQQLDFHLYLSWKI